MRKRAFEPVPVAIVLAAMVLVALVRLRLAGTPLERDEGEYAYAGQLILHGVPPYRLVYNMKLPGTYYAYAAILASLGPTPWGIHLGLLLVNAATIVLVFLLGRRLLDGPPAAVAAAAFALLSVDSGVLGVFAHATHFVMLFAVAGLLALVGALESATARATLGSGLLLGTSVLMKQHAIFFPLLGAVLILWQRRDAGVRLGWFAAGAGVPFLLVVAVLGAQGVLGRFWFWTFTYAREYVGEEPVGRALPRLAGSLATVTSASLPLWLLAGAGAVALWVGRWPGRVRRVVTGFGAASFLALCPGFYFREHYFVLLLPAAALCCGVAVAELGRGRSTAAGVAIFLAVAGTYVIRDRAYLFRTTGHDVVRSLYGGNPFIEAPEIARYVRARTTRDDRIAVIGSEPEIYFYADRPSATGYIYTYALMEPQPYAPMMQREMIREIEGAHPRYVIFVDVDTSWLVRPGSDPGIGAWANRYTAECYDLVGIADIQADTTVYRWDDETTGYRPRSPSVVYTFRRKSDAPCTAPPG